MKNEANLLIKTTERTVTELRSYCECSECGGIMLRVMKKCPYCQVTFEKAVHVDKDEITKLRHKIRQCAMDWVKFWYKGIQPASVLEAALFDYTDNLEDLSEIAKQNILQSIDETYNLIDKMSKNENDT